MEQMLMYMMSGISGIAVILVFMLVVKIYSQANTSK